MEENKNIAIKMDQQENFYKSLPNFFHAVSGKSVEEQIVNALRSQSPVRLSWTHYRIILQENTGRGRRVHREIEQQKEFFRLQHKED